MIEIDAASGTAKGRIAIDAKDERLSKNRAWDTLNAALAERDAGFAILLVASDEKVPAGRQQLQEYEGNKMIVTLDKETLDGRALELAYRYARCRCLMSAERDLALDAAGVRDAAEEALSALKDAQKIRSSLTGASKSVDAARDTLDTMVTTGRDLPHQGRVANRRRITAAHLSKEDAKATVRDRDAAASMRAAGQRASPETRNGFRVSGEALCPAAPAKTKVSRIAFTKSCIVRIPPLAKLRRAFDPGERNFTWPSRTWTG